MYEYTSTCDIYAKECVCVCVCVCVNFNLIAWLEVVFVVLIAKSCLTLCESMDHDLPDSSVHEISQQEYYGLPFPFPRDLLNSGIEPASLELQMDSLMLSHEANPWLEVNLNQKQLALVTCL